MGDRAQTRDHGHVTVARAVAFCLPADQRSLRGRHAPLHPHATLLVLACGRAGQARRAGGRGRSPDHAGRGVRRDQAAVRHRSGQLPEPHRPGGHRQRRVPASLRWPGHARAAHGRRRQDGRRSVQPAQPGRDDQDGRRAQGPPGPHRGRDHPADRPGVERQPHPEDPRRHDLRRPHGQRGGQGAAGRPHRAAARRSATERGQQSRPVHRLHQDARKAQRHSPGDAHPRQPDLGRLPHQRQPVPDPQAAPGRVHRQDPRPDRGPTQGQRLDRGRAPARCWSRSWPRRPPSRTPR